MPAYTDLIEHLFAEMKRIDALIKRAVVLERSNRPTEVPADLRGLAVFEPEIDAFLTSQNFLEQHWYQATKDVENAVNALDREIVLLRQKIDTDVADTLKKGEIPPLVRLAAIFGLSPIEVDVLLVALAPEIEPRYEQLFAYLQNDVTRKRPSIDLAANLLAAAPAAKVKIRNLLTPQSPLLRHRLLMLVPEPHDSNPSLLRRALKLDDGIAHYLLSSDQPPSPSLAFHSLEETPAQVETSEASKKDLDNLISTLERRGADRAIIHLTASHLDTAQSAALFIAHSLLRPLIEGNLVFLSKEPATAAIWWRDAILSNAILAITHTTPEGEPESESLEAALWRDYEASPAPVILIGSGFTSARFPSGAPVFPLHLAAPEAAAERQIWTEALAAHPDGFDVAQLAEAFPLPRTSVARIVSIAEAYASIRNPSDPHVTTDDLLRAGRSLSTPRLAEFAISIDPRYTWDDIVLPDAQMQQLKRLAGRLRNRARVMQEWGFAEKMSRGRGLSILFTGGPGVGKTMAAEVLAKELNLRLFQIDLPSVVSKYIGETTKNLSSIFREAELTQSLLFFDEADALFGKRAEVKDAQDRYANLEINYLLQRLEVYEGPVILSTNLQKNMDEAFLRRLQEMVEFPMPDEEQRAKIWEKHLPKSAPRGDINFEFLARRFPLSGGNIRNALLSAAFRAAETNEPISMQHIVPSIELEMQKQGRIVMKTDLGKYSKSGSGVM